MVNFVLIQKLKMALSSASISRDRFLSFPRYCGVRTSLADNCSSLSTTDWRELFRSVSIRWMLLRSWLVKSSIAMVASHTGGLWLGARSGYNRSASRSAYNLMTEKKATKKERISPLFPAKSRDFPLLEVRG